MIATNVEELICALETFDAEQLLCIGILRGKSCIFVGNERIPITLPTDANIYDN